MGMQRWIVLCLLKAVEKLERSSGLNNVDRSEGERRLRRKYLRKLRKIPKRGKTSIGLLISILDLLLKLITLIWQVSSKTCIRFQTSNKRLGNKLHSTEDGKWLTFQTRFLSWRTTSMCQLRNYCAWPDQLSGTPRSRKCQSQMGVSERLLFHHRDSRLFSLV
jgi:hypothetical protein